MKYSLLLSLLLLAGTTCALSNTISVSPASLDVTVGQTFAVDIDIDSIPDLSAFQFTLNFDPTVLSADDITEGPLFANTNDSFPSPGPIDNSAGTVSFYDTLIGDVYTSVPGPGILAVADFTATGPGTISFSFSNVQIYDPSVFTDANAAPLPVTTVSGTVDAVTAEPATLYLLAPALGLMLFGLWRRSKGGAQTFHT